MMLLEEARPKSLILDQDYIRKAIDRNYYYAEIPASEWHEYIKPHIGMFESTSG